MGTCYTDTHDTLKPMFRSGAARLVMLVGALSLPEEAAMAITEEQAVAAVERFVAAWNTRDPDAFAATLQYPHVRPAATGGAHVFATPEEYAAGIDFARVLATGWDHSELDSARVIHLGRDKAHVAGQYTRYREDGSKLWSYQVTYVVTEGESGEVGIQARFPSGLVLASEEERRQAEQAAVRVVRDFLAAFNARDEEAWAATLHYPHVRVAGGEVRVWKTPETYTQDFDFDAFAARLGWHHSVSDSIEAIQVAADAVNVALRVSRYAADGKRLSGFETLHLVTREGGEWGIRARSSFAP